MYHKLPKIAHEETNMLIMLSLLEVLFFREKGIFMERLRQIKKGYKGKLYQSLESSKPTYGVLLTNGGAIFGSLVHDYDKSVKLLALDQLLT